MASVPLMAGIMSGFVISEGYRYIYSWFSGDTTSDRNTSITINIGDRAPNAPPLIEDNPVVIHSNEQIKLLEQLQDYDVKKLKSVTNQERNMIECDILDELRLKMSNRRNKLLCE